MLARMRGECPLPGLRPAATHLLRGSAAGPECMGVSIVVNLESPKPEP